MIDRELAITGYEKSYLCKLIILEINHLFNRMVFEKGMF